MTERAFLDTNVLVYADDADAGEDKREMAQQLLREALTLGTGVISTQVLQEFFVVSTRKLGVEPAIARRKVALLSTLDVVRIRCEDVLAAIDLHRLYALSFWDALIVRCALVAGCTRLVTEDLQDGQVFEGLTVDNPFPA
ncbi:MAG: PIN domain-containing protein [Myxococcota bacterium]